MPSLEAMTGTMKAIRFHQTGGPEVLRFEDVELPPPGPGEVRIRHTAVALNFRDILVRRGQHAAKLPSGLGSESAGVIEAVGPGVTDLAVGDRVDVRLPPGLRLCRGAQRAGRARPQTAERHRRAHRRLDDGPRHDRALPAARNLSSVKPGDTIVIHAAAGGVGLIVEPMGQAPRRDGDRHRRQHGQDRDREGARLRSRVLATTISLRRSAS